LGKGGFGKVVLARRKAPDGHDQLVAIKALRKANIISCCNVSFTITEKEALILASAHPFVTTLYTCFQTKASLNSLNLLHISRESLIPKFTISMKM
jgi:novel protein kinase C epsilon type